MKRLVAFIAISLLSSIANAAPLTWQDCKDAVPNSKKEVKVPSTLVETSESCDAMLNKDISTRYRNVLAQEKLKQEAESIKINKQKEIESQLVIDGLKNQKEIEAALVKKDDATCKSYGAKKGSPAYVQCRSTQVANRQEAADRQKTIDVLEKKIEALQSQMQSQASAQSAARERDQRISAEQYASEQEFKNKQIQLQQEQLRTLQQQQAQAREAARWEAIRQMNDPAQWNQKAPPLPQPVTPHRYNCYPNGAYTTCQ